MLEPFRRDPFGGGGGGRNGGIEEEEEGEKNIQQKNENEVDEILPLDRWSVGSSRRSAGGFRRLD